MPYLLGTDEAGYGPNLGPLVISSSLWRVNDVPAQVDLYRLFERVLTSTSRDPNRLAIADSKRLYQPGGGLEPLERTLLPLLQLCGREVRSWREVFERLAPGCLEASARIPWYAGYDAALPEAFDPRTLDGLRRAVGEEFERVGASLVEIQSVVVDPERLNGLINQMGTKGAALTHLTLELVERTMRSAQGEPLLVYCDKHGGRNKYGQVLQERFPEYLVEVHGESTQESVYRWGPTECRVEARFVAKGERMLPVALASMASKYLRELAMQAFNAFWRKHLPRLKPTAGYPVDAVRFRAEIEEVRARLGIDPRILWRNR